MKLPKEYSGTTLLKGSRVADPKYARELAQSFTKDVLPLRKDEALNDLTEIIRNYIHEAHDSIYIQNHVLRDWLTAFVEAKQEELKLVWKDPAIVHTLYPEHIDQVLQRIRDQLSNAKAKLSKLEGVPTNVKGDFLENGLINELLLFRKKYDLTTGHTHNSYMDTNDSVGSCVPWVQKIVNALAAPLNKQFSNQAIKERIIKIRNQNNELK